MLLVGNPGTGKTHLATALGFAACTQGKRVRFTSTTGLVTLLLEQRDIVSLLVSGCATMVKVVDNYPATQHRGSALISGRNHSRPTGGERNGWNVALAPATRQV